LIGFLFENNITGIGEVGQQRGKGVNFVTVANQYKEQLQKLIDKLYSTSPHFIRCIIPNNEKKPGILEDQIVLDQLRCNGVLEGIRITRKGFPNRIIYAEFLKRYYLLGTKIPRHAPDARGAVASLLDQLGIKAAQYRFGVTKVFFKTGEIGRIEEMREKKIGELLISVQAGARGYLARQFYKRMTERTVAIRIIQRNIRVWVGFKNWPWWKLFAKVKPLFKSRNFDLEIKEKQSKIDDLAKKIDEESKKNASLESSVKNLENQLQDINGKLKKEKENTQDLEDDKAELEEQKADLQKKLKTLQAELEDSTADLGDLEKDRLAAKKEAKELGEKLEIESKARAQLEDIKNKQAVELEKLNTLHEQESEEITKLKRSKDQLEKQVEELLDNVDKESGNRGALEKIKKKLEQEIDETSSKLEEEIKNRNNTEKERKRLEGLYNETKAKLETEQTGRTNEESERKKLQVEHNQLKADMESELKKTDTLTKAKKKILKMNSKMSKINWKVQTIPKHLSKNQKEIWKMKLTI